MTTHRKRKIEIIVEKPFAPRMLELLARHGAKGYSTLPVLAGAGRHGQFVADELTGIAETVMIIAIVSPGTAAAITQALAVDLENIRAVVTFADVEVIRDDHF